MKLNIFFFFRIRTHVFIAISQEIEVLFLEEISSTYYSPYQSHNGVSVPPPGSPYFHHNYVKEYLRKHHLLESPKANKKVGPPTCKDIPVNGKLITL